MRAILLSLGLMLSIQTAASAEEAPLQPHIYDCAGALSDDKEWLEKDLANYAREAGIQIFLTTPSLKNERCDERIINQQEELKKKISNTVIITLLSAPENDWIEVTLTADLIRRFGLKHITINLGPDEKVLQITGKALIVASDTIRNHFASMNEADEAAALLNSESADDPYGSDVTTPLQETIPIEPSDIPPDEGDEPVTPDAPKKPFRPEGQPI